MPKQILTEKEIEELLSGDETITENLSDPKDAFIDSVNPHKYIELDSNSLAFDRVHRALNRNLKMTLIYGVPGTGKSMFLSRLHNELLVQNKNSILIASPILDEDKLFQTIGFEIFKESNLQALPKNFDELIETIAIEREFLKRYRPILLLDEAQLYSNRTLEKIRLITDSQVIRVVFVVHKLREENIFTKEHFQSRIWEKIELTNATPNELKVYIQKKLMGISMLALANQFTTRVVRRIYRITKGNYRATNNLLYAYFNNYPQTWKPQFGKKPLKIRPKEIEITAIQIEFLKPRGSAITDIKHLPTAEILWKKWRNRERLKYASFLIVPASIYTAIQFYIAKVEEEKPIPQVATSSIEEKPPLLIFPKPELQKIDEVAENVLEEKENPIQKEENITTPPIKKIVPKKIEIVEEVPENSIAQEENPPIESLFKDVEVTNSENETNNETPQSSTHLNISLAEVGSKTIFQKKLYLSPQVPLVPDFVPTNRWNRAEEIEKMVKEFEDSKDIEIGKKIVDYYLKNREYDKVYQYSLELNQINPDLVEPYQAIKKVLSEIGAEE